MSIRPLPNNVIEKIKSSSSIVSLNCVICGLAKNSLDSGALKVDIVLDYVRGNCTVQDDGEGIPAKEFAIDGGLAKPNSSSRFPHFSTYHGRYGNFLASLAALSLVIISSHTAEEMSHSSLTINRGAITSTKAADASAQYRASFSHGTRVAVFDLFGSMPVRVKHRASVFSTPSYLEKEFKALTHDLTALLLAWPTSISLSLREVTRDCQLRMRCLDGLDLTQRTARLLLQAGFSDFSELGSWIPVAASNGSISVEGCISTIPVATRSLQFISLGIHSLEHFIGGNVLLEEVNEIFTSSSFGVVEDAGSHKASPNRPLPTDWKPKKGLERWPMLYLKFESDDMVTRNFLRSHNSTMAAIISLLRAVCYAFLRKHKMRPRKSLRNQLRSSPTEKRGQRSLFQDDQPAASMANTTEKPLRIFDTWRRIKAGQRSVTSLPHNGSGSKNLVGAGGQLLRTPFCVEDRDESFAQGLCSDPDDHFSRKNSPRAAETFETHCRESHNRWLEKLVQSWRNPVFETVEAAVQRLPNVSDFDSLEDSNHRSFSTNISGQVSKSSLAKADIIAQVDSKFILIKLPLASSIGSASSYTAQCALFAVDQHAADERCRLEELKACYFEETEGKSSPVIETLDEPLSFSISGKETNMFAKGEAFWRGWGIIYQVVDAGDSGRCNEEHPTSIEVTGLPPSILERCRGEPRLLLDLLRRELWSIEDNLGTERPKTSPNSNFHGCPRGILELLNSRACRSAIMFNDELTLAECTSLVRRLAQCSLPFQCAHGRPSMAPLVDLGSKTDSVLGTLSDSCFCDSTAMPVMPNPGAWTTWMDQHGHESTALEPDASESMVAAAASGHQLHV